MTIGAWLRERASAPPQLTNRVIEVVGDRLDAPFENASDVLIESAARLLGDLVSRRSAGRESALDLLTVDALVTYAFEAASVSPESLSARAEDAMRLFASLAAA